MRGWRICLLILFGFLFAIPTRGSDWQYMGVMTDGSKIYIDKETIKTKGHIRSYWDLVWLPKEETDSPSGKAYKWYLEYWEADCTEGISTLYEMVYYALDRTLVDQTILNQPMIMRNVPNSMRDVNAKYVCNFKSGK